MEATVEILPLLTIGSQTDFQADNDFDLKNQPIVPSVSIELLTTIHIGSQTDFQADNDFDLKNQPIVPSVSIELLTTIHNVIEFEVSDFKTKTIREPIPPINIFPLTTIHNVIEFENQVCFDVQTQFNEADNLSIICKSKSKNSDLYDAIARINEEVVLDFLYDSNLNPFFHYAPYLCGNIQRDKCSENIERCNLRNSSYWLNNKISILEQFDSKEDECKISTTTPITDEYLSTVSYLSMFYKNRIPFNPKNIDYYLQCLGYLEYGESSFDIVCARADYYTNISKDILYRDWLKLSPKEQDKYTITNTIYIYPRYRKIVDKDISPRQGKYSINTRISTISISNQVQMSKEEFLNIDEIVTTLSEEIERIERIVDIEEYQVEVDKLEEIKKSLEYLTSFESDISNRVSLVDLKLNEFAKIVADTFEAI